MKTAGKSVPEAKQALYSSNFRVAKRALESITNRDEEFDF